MHSSLTILIILTVVVLIAILMTSPTCKNAVGAILKGKKKRVEKPTNPPSAPAVEAPAPKKPQVASAPKPRAPTPVVQSPAKVEASQPQMEVKSDPQYRVLTGNVLDMFNNTVDVQSEFGVTDEQIDLMARQYKVDHLDVHKEEVTRHRSFVRSAYEEADAKLREGFQQMMVFGKKPNTEEAIIAMREEKITKGEDLTNKRKKPIKMVMSGYGRK